MANFELEPCIGEGPIEPRLGFDGPEVLNLQNKPKVTIVDDGTTIHTTGKARIGRDFTRLEDTQGGKDNLEERTDEMLQRFTRDAEVTVIHQTVKHTIYTELDE